MECTAALELHHLQNGVMIQFEAILMRTVYDYSLRSRYQSDLARSKSHGSSNLTGRINNLMTSDIANIAAGVEMFFIGVYMLTLATIMRLNTP